MKKLEITKTIIIHACNDTCKYFTWIPKGHGAYKINRYVCKHDSFESGRGCKIINIKYPLNAAIPKWCPLEDWED